MILRATPALKAIAAAGILLGFLAESPFREAALACRRLSSDEKQRRRARRCSAYARAMLDAMGFRASLWGVEHLRALEARGEGFLIASNHLAFWDIVLLSAQTSVVYITSVEVGETPVLGAIARAAGCVFVERRDRLRTGEAVDAVAGQLARGVPVALYAEGTTSDGSGVLPFKRSFFSAAIRSGAPVLPVCINYRSIDGEPVSVFNRDRLFYYGDQTFLAQLTRIFAAREIVAELTFVEPIQTAGLERDALARAVEDVVRNHYEPIVPKASCNQESQHEIAQSRPHRSAVFPGAAP